jgi:hypothetical protein
VRILRVVATRLLVSCLLLVALPGWAHTAVAEWEIDEATIRTEDLPSPLVRGSSIRYVRAWVRTGVGDKARCEYLFDCFGRVGTRRYINDASGIYLDRTTAFASATAPLDLIPRGSHIAAAERIVCERYGSRGRMMIRTTDGPRHRSGCLSSRPPTHLTGRYRVELGNLLGSPTGHAAWLL